MTTTDLPKRETAHPHRIVILGGGHVGLHVAKRLHKKLRRGEAHVTVIDSRPYMTYQPFLPEVGAGSIEPRHAVVPLRAALPKFEVLTATVTKIDTATQTLRVRPAAGPGHTVEYDTLIVALGSVPRTLPIPGLAEHGIGFKQIEEAVACRNHVLDQLDLAESTTDPDLRRKALTFTVVGGGFAGVEALAELEDLTHDAAKNYRSITDKDIRWVLVEHANRILPEVGPELGEWARQLLTARGVEVRLGVALNSCENKHVVLSDGTEFDTSTIVWTAGVKPSEALSSSDLPLGPRGHVDTRPTLQVAGLDNVWSAGDNAQVPDLSDFPSDWCAPNAQHAVRQAAVLADNVLASLRGKPVAEYKHKYVGSVAGLGLGKGAAHVYGMKLRGWPAWVMHRSYHAKAYAGARKPILLGWMLGSSYRKGAVSMGALKDPRQAFRDVANH